MGRRDTGFILSKKETTYGTDAVPVAATNAVLVEKLSGGKVEVTYATREPLVPHFGAREQLVASTLRKLTFSTEAAGSGAAGTAPAWGFMLKACGFAETVSAGNRVDYTPIYTGIDALTHYDHEAGVLFKHLGSRGSMKGGFNAGERPMFDWDWLSLDGGESAVGDPTPVYTTWQKPVVANASNTGDVMIGCTYSAGALSGGTAYPMTAFSWDLGAKTEMHETTAGQEIVISSREIKGAMTIELTAAQEVSLLASLRAVTQTGVGLLHGSVAGNIIGAFGGQVALSNFSSETVKGIRLGKFDLSFNPTAAGNDDFRLWQK